MSDYVYKPLEPEQNKASTSITDLDEIEILKRHSDEFNKVITPDNAYPDLLKKPLYMATVPETLGSSTSPTVLPKTATLSDLSIKELFYKITKSFMDIINGLFALKWDNNFTNNLLEVFTKEDRLLSTGVLMVIFSIFMVFLRKN
jgi:hypothetical protein